MISSVGTCTRLDLVKDIDRSLHSGGCNLAELLTLIPLCFLSGAAGGTGRAIKNACDLFQVVLLNRPGLLKNRCESLCFRCKG